MTVRLRKLWMIISVFGFIGILMWGCANVELDDPVVYNYDDTPILITNPDWGIIPLVNNFLNPVQQAEIPVEIPGVEVTETPTTVALPTVGEKAAAKAQSLGYPVEEDSDLTKALLKGMNKLDGFVKNVPIRIPFSKQIDMDSLEFFDGQNIITLSDQIKAANFFFLDITDPNDVKVIKDFNFPFNFEMSENYPYYLTLRLDETGMMATDYTPGHTYLIVITGLDEERGLKSLEGNPFMPDGYFSLFASETPYIAEDGSIRNNIISVSTEECNAELEKDCTQEDVKDLVKAMVQELEGGRQITNYGLEIWEKLVTDTVEELKTGASADDLSKLENVVRDRQEVIAAFHFTTVSNPFAVYMDATNVLFSPTQNAFKVEPIDYAAYESADSGKVIVNKAEACLDSEMKFSFSSIVQKVKSSTVNGDSIKLFKVNDGELSEVDSSVSYDSDSLEVTIKADDNLEANTEYAVAVNNKIIGSENDRPAVDETYFGITRPDTPLVNDTTWLSPHLDSRIDVLIAAGFLNPGKDVSLFEQNPTEDTKADREQAIKDASASTMQVLKVIEKMRQVNSPFMPKLVEEGFVDELEDVILFWTFTTGNGCDQ